MKILSLINHPHGGCEYYRQITPLHSIKDRCTIKGVNTLSQMSDDEIKEYDIFQIIRKDMFGNIDRCKSLGLKIIFDIDDYWNLDSTHLLFKNYKEIKMDRHVYDCFSKSDIVTTTQSYLADKIKNFHQNVEIIPNCIIPEEPQFETVHKSHEKTRVGWVGGVHHIEDIKMLRECFGKLWSDSSINNKFEVIVGGYVENSDVHKFFASIFTANYHTIAKENTILVNAMDVRSFARTYELCDILLAPLKDSEFNRCKSNLKILEAGWKGKMVVASHVHPYSQTITHGDDGMLISNKRSHIDWYRTLRNLILNPDEIKRMGSNLETKIKAEYNIHHYSENIYNIYKSVLQR